eukprot:1192135-Prorocentrum_minimum.AAC.1
MADLEQAAKKQRVEESDAAAQRKTKPCAKFFSVSGCPYWDGCNFMHANPTGIPLVSSRPLGMPSYGGGGSG